MVSGVGENEFKYEKLVDITPALRWDIYDELISIIMEDCCFIWWGRGGVELGVSYGTIPRCMRTYNVLVSILTRHTNVVVV